MLRLLVKLSSSSINEKGSKKNEGKIRDTIKSRQPLSNPLIYHTFFWHRLAGQFKEKIMINSKRRVRQRLHVIVILVVVVGCIMLMTLFTYRCPCYCCHYKYVTFILFFTDIYTLYISGDWLIFITILRCISSYVRQLPWSWSSICRKLKGGWVKFKLWRD